MNKFLLNGLATGISILFLSHSSFSQNGALDVTFGNGGRQTLNIGTSDDFGKAIARQPNGYYVMAGTTSRGNGDEIGLIRMDETGYPDMSFGIDGIVTYSFGGATINVEAMRIQTDGKILVAGSVAIGSEEMFLMRFNESGTIDYDFGSGGLVRADITYGNDRAKSIVLLPDGMIILGGYGYENGLVDLMMVRYTDNGQTDGSFGVNGVVRLPTQVSDMSDIPFSMDRMINGNLVLGFTQMNDFLIVCTDEYGNLDNTFAGDGMAEINLSGNDDTLHFVKVLSNSTILAGGTSWIGGNYIASVGRVNNDGTRDNNFNSTGIYSADGQGLTNVFHQATEQGDGRLVLAGNLLNGNLETDYLIVRLEWDGYIDNSFGGTGTVVRDHGESNDVATAVDVDPLGNIFVGGYAFMKYYERNFNFTLIKLTYEGYFSNDFGNEGSMGLSNLNIGTNQDFVHAIGRQSTGRIITAGYSFNGGLQNLSLARFYEYGGIDYSFGISGKIQKEVGHGSGMINAMLILPDNKILVVGSISQMTHSDIFLARYNADGSDDLSFGLGGYRLTDIGNGTYEWGTSIAVQPDGKIIVGGYTGANGNMDFVLLRYLANGTPDNSFGANGLVVTDLEGGNDYVYTVGVQPDGMILAGGSARNGSNDGMALVRYNSGGDIDFGFGSMGRVITVVGNSNDEGKSLDIQFDGKIVLGGTANISGEKLAIVRFNTDGSLDTEFDEDGKLAISVGLSIVGKKILVQEDRRILMSGEALTNTGYDFAVARVTRYGVPDASFGTNGIVIASPLSGFSNLTSMLVQPDGNIVLGGFAMTGSNFDAGLVRLVNTMQTLPLNWVGFTATRYNEQVQLKWETSEEKNTRDFAVEYSTNQRDWTLLNTITSNANAAGLGKYVYTHTTPSNGANYYRIQQRDVDGKKSISETRMVQFGGKLFPITIMNNPVISGQLQIRIAGQDAAAQLVSIFQADGRMIYQKKLANGAHTINLSGYAAGTYLLKSGGQTERILVK